VEYVNTEIFWDFELMFNVIDHAYQPKFELMSVDEIDAFKKTYLLTNSEIPKMEKTDMIARYYNLSIGDVIRIIRPSSASGYSVVYKIVINAPYTKLFDR